METIVKPPAQTPNEQALDDIVSEAKRLLLTGPSRPIRQFPHCDALVLHAPGACEYCDLHPDWQQLREMWGIAFTGEVARAKTICPSERRRPLALINQWPGNQARPPKKPPHGSKH
jgi:hypothetical protein